MHRALQRLFLQAQVLLLGSQPTTRYEAVPQPFTARPLALRLQSLGALGLPLGRSLQWWCAYQRRTACAKRRRSFTCPRSPRLHWPWPYALWRFGGRVSWHTLSALLEDYYSATLDLLRVVGI